MLNEDAVSHLFHRNIHIYICPVHGHMVNDVTLIFYSDL